MNPFTDHPNEQGISYWEHWRFAMGIAYRLLSSVVAFAIHAVLPFISIEPRFDLEATTAFLAEQNDWIESSREAGHAQPQADDISFNPALRCEIS